MSDKFISMDGPSICDCEEKTALDAGDMLCINDSSDSNEPKMVKVSNLMRAPEVFNAQTDDYTLVLADGAKTVQMNKATAVVLTVPAHADVAFAVGVSIPIENLGAGVLTVEGDDGVTVNAAGGVTTFEQYVTGRVKKVAENVWLLTVFTGETTPPEPPTTATFTTTETGVFTINTRGAKFTGMWVDWGDGSDLEWVQHIGGNSVITNHDYSGASGTKTIVFSGELSWVTYFNCQEPLLAGQISEFLAFTNLDYLTVANTDIEGDYSVLLTLPIVRLAVHNCPLVTGVIGPLSNNQHQIMFYCYGSGVSGSVSNVGGADPPLMEMTDFRVNGRGENITGDFGDLAPMEALLYVQVQGTAVGYNTTTLPVWNNIDIRIQDCDLTTDEVDNLINDLAATNATNGKLNIAGTNAARSSASDAGKATLLSNGWTLTLNE
jgi:hypothetical protein